jgi:hypothetical protein
MTIEEKLKMYKEKERFVEAISGVFQTTKHNSTIEGISYEVYNKSFGGSLSETREYIVVYYAGGAKAPRTVSGYNCTAIYRIIGDLLNGGYYEEVLEFDSLLEAGYERIGL